MIESNNSTHNRWIKYCVVNSCEYFKGTRDESVRMFRFPKDQNVAQKWNVALGIDINKTLRGLVCINHFANECFARPNKSKLTADAVPTIFAPTTSLSSSSSSASSIAIAKAHSSPSTIATIANDATANVDTDVPFLSSAFDVSDSVASTPAHSSPSTIATVSTDATANVRCCHKCVEIDRLIEQKDQQIQKLRSLLKKAQKKIYYLETIKRKLEIAFSELKKKSLINDELSKALKELESKELLRILHHGIKGGTKYSEKVRFFCISLVYFSPRAYEYIRKTFNNHLPNIQTIRNWFANSDIKSDPGIEEEHMQRLKRIAQDFETQHKRKLECSLVFDEINIRQQVSWSMQQLDFTGFVNYGQNKDTEEKAVAKQALVFILKGIDANFEFPVAYYFIDSLNKYERKHLLNDILTAVIQCGIKITNITFDGLSANAAMCELFGAKLNVYNKDFRTYIFDPVNKQKIYIILDPCHMEKLVRNTLSNRKVFTIATADNHCSKIEWRYFESLYNYSRDNNVRTHKLTKKHIQWKNNCMNVRLAIETFSNSVANSIQFLMEQGVEEFQGAEATIDFIRRMDKLFNIFNSKYSEHKNIFKRNLSPENKRIVFDFLNEMKEYFKSLKVEEEYFVGKKKSKNAIKKFKLVPLLKTRNYCAFRGFIIDIDSLKAIYTEYVEELQLLREIPTYNLLQDVIEMFFGRIRGCGGYNNNPNTQQFKGAYRKLQANMKLDLSMHSNCRAFDLDLPDNLFYSNVYFVSSRRAKISMDKHNYKQQKDSILDEVNEDFIAAVDVTPDATVDSMDANYHLLDSTSNFMTAYIASVIEKKIMECTTFHCVDCLSVFSENEKMNTISTHLLPWRPCVSTVNICKNAERFFKLYDPKTLNARFDFKVLYCLIFRTMNFDSLFSNTAFECDASHKYQFIKCIVGQYISIRANQAAKQITLDRHSKLIRQKYSRLVNFHGQ